MSAVRPTEPVPVAPPGGPDEPADAADDATDGTSGDGSGRARARRDGAVRNLIEWVLIIGGAFLVAFVVKTFLIQAFFIPSGSMLPTLETDDRVLVNKLSYDLHAVNRGDLIVFERPEGAVGEIKDLIKRVVALEGETIEAIDGQVYVDGRRVEEPYLAPGTRTEDLEATQVPEGHVFVLGDNRTNSTDSRRFDAISEDTIVGRAFVRVWPLTDLSLL
ncbi:MAG: signal peptidase I [Acidimicrobiia bacterium]|nr:signal peptidase I [Acidimicrobiia bacterium]